ncbi:exodeoxyribonuclease V subunit gamma [Marinospirillum alkaliphilum]|uniref:RecBCD enzyme subunit RecC n=1 Tax=Marinospirillum alkaliphilum DSM 21637 TaxID=1122209 RepID=A0A1K1YNY3_9GAMM|nr:exodeoxyribonuclease V subunit gamma [Marinospirillum alkaliphilum]SFX63713.1 DNA helicase/exodeoxyribonuclease V, gamma subunit [Marinospirillum alkaliphilum DSM 21637]
MTSSLTPGLMILQGNRLEDLREVMVQWIAEHPLGPLENECILVQSNGIAQWLKMALAADPASGPTPSPTSNREQRGCGIAAAMRVELPGRFIWQAYRSIFPDLPATSPYDKQPLSWRLYRLLEQLESRQATLDQPEHLQPLSGFLATDPDDPRRLHQLAANLADLYDQYQVYRADWLTRWEAGEDLLIRAHGHTEPLPDDQLWQPLLWRWLKQDIESDTRLGQGQWDRASRAAIHQRVLSACQTLSAQQRPAGLPRRVMVFGISSLPRQTLELLEAVSNFSQVLIFAANPCRHYWGDLIEHKALLQQQYRRIRERKLPDNLTPEQLHLHGHPLLASWGKQGRDYLHLLDEKDQPDHYRQQFAGHIDLFTSPLQQAHSPQPGLLQQLQDDLLELRPLNERQQLSQDSHWQLDPTRDTSLQFTIAHSPQREVEILHDQLLDAFETAQQQGSPLQPRDVLVMVPDINVYAPHIQAVFSNSPLPFHIADQGQRRHNPLLIAVEKLLQLPGSRFAVSELLDLLDTPALRLRFGIEATDLPRLRQWIRGANIRWGLDATQRASLGLPEGLQQNTWLAGLQRMLLGHAAGQAPAWQGIEPYDEVAGLEAALLGPLVLLIEHLRTLHDLLQQSHSPDTWISLLQQLLNQSFAAADSEDSQLLAQLAEQLQRLQQQWQQAGLQSLALPLPVVREALLAGMDEPGLTRRFLGGSINFATLMPMRAIPFRQVWLLGMNDGDYPRSSRHAHFDLMADDYRPGDRSRREDDRYLFLEALLSARERLVISWVGRDVRDNSERPPSVLVAQLRDHLAAGWRLQHQPDASPETLLAALTTEHPLQAFSERYFQPDRDPRLFTYASEWREVHALQSTSPPDETRISGLPEGTLTLTDLERFLRQPVAAFYTRRLGIHWQDRQELPEDSETFAVDGRLQWQLHQHLIERITGNLARQHHRNQAANGLPTDAPEQLLQQAVTALQRSGHLALPPFSAQQQQALHEQLLTPLQDYVQLLQAFPLRQPTRHHQWSIHATLQLEADISDIRSNSDGQCIRLLLQPGRLSSGNSLKWYQLVRHWPQHLLAQLQHPCCTHILASDQQLLLPALPADQAESLLLDLADVWQLGMQQLLPLPCKTAFASLQEKGDPRRVYEGDGYRMPGEIQDHPALPRFWPDFDSLAAQPEFSELASRLYQPLLQLLDQEAST